MGLLNADIRGKAWEFPLGGRMQHSYFKQKSLITSTNIHTALSVGTGNSGVVRSIMVMCSESPAVMATNVLMEVYYDGSGTAAFSVPLGDFFNLHNPTVNQCQSINTPFVSAQGIPGVSPVMAGAYALYYPIPYTNGIVIKFKGSDATPFALWTDIEYQDQLPACWNRNLRFQVSRTSSTVAGTTAGAGILSITIGSRTITNSASNFTSGYVGRQIKTTGATRLAGDMDDVYVESVESGTSLTIAACDVQQIIATNTITQVNWRLCNNHTWLSRPAGTRGFVVSTTAGLINAAADYTAYLEAKVRILADQSASPTYTSSGFEDFFRFGFYGDVFNSQLLNAQGPYGGLMAHDVTTGAISAYRVFAPDPVPYVNGIVGKAPNYDANTLTQTWLTCYYEFV